jgi:hypothetical protein
MSDETWLTDRKVDASKKKFFVATEIIVFDFELFIGELVKNQASLEYNAVGNPVR